MTVCKHCKIAIHDEKTFCSHRCRALFHNPNRKGLTYKAWDEKRALLEQEYLKKSKLICQICSQQIPYKRRTKKTCSPECLQEFRRRHKELLRNIPHTNNGGFREGSGRGKSGWFSGIFCSSTYELAYVIYCLDHQIQISRNTQSWEYFNPSTGKVSKYYPDFIVGGSDIIEIKGYPSPIVDAKIKAVRDSGHPIQILYTEDLKEVFAYVQMKTGLTLNSIPTLYEKTKNKHSFTCKFCKAQYEHVNKNSVFCSQSCAGKERLKIRWSDKRRERDSNPLEYPE